MYLMRMKAIVYETYGPPEVLHLQNVEKPSPKDDEVLVRVHAASVNAADWRLMRADPFLVRFHAGLRKPTKFRVLGADIAPGALRQWAGMSAGSNREMRYSEMYLRLAWAGLPNINAPAKVNWF